MLRGARAMRYRTAWCWQVPASRTAMTGEVFTQIYIDGLYLHGGWVLLVACTDEHVLNWQWATSENSAAYKALLAPLAPADLITTDGAGGALKAIKALWPDTPIQRCLVHIDRQSLRDLAASPRSAAGKALLKLLQELKEIETIEAARQWLTKLNAFHLLYKDWLNQRTQAKQDPAYAARTGKKWWYTHQRTRRVYQRLQRLQRQGQLFAYLQHPDGTPRDKPLKEHTNEAESINSVLRGLLQAHRGASSQHQAQILEWALLKKSINPPTSAQVLTAWQAAGKPAPTRLPTPRRTRARRAPQRPPLVTDHTNLIEDGLWLRQGWAGDN